MEGWRKGVLAQATREAPRFSMSAPELEEETVADDGSSNQIYPEKMSVDHDDRKKPSCGR